MYKRRSVHPAFLSPFPNAEILSSSGSNTAPTWGVPAKNSGALYCGREKRVLIISNDLDNADPSFGFLAVIPRTTSINGPSAGRVTSQANDANCGEGGFFSCLDILKVNKDVHRFVVDGQVVSRIIGLRYGEVDSERMKEVDLALKACVKPPIPDHLRRIWKGEWTKTVPVRRGMLIRIEASCTTWFAVVLTDTWLRSQQHRNIATVVPLDLLSDWQENPANDTVIFLENSDKILRYAVLSRMVRTVDFSNQIVRFVPVLDEGRHPLFFRTSQTDLAASAVLRYLGIEKDDL